MATHTPGLLSLPSEMIREIFLHLDNAVDAVVLGLATERLWRAGEDLIIRLVHRQMASWAGSRLICVGDYVSATDYPPGIMLDNQLLARIKGSATQEKEENGAEDEDERVRTLYYFAEQFSRCDESYWSRRGRAPRIQNRLPKRKCYFAVDSGLNPKAVDRLYSEFSEWTKHHMDEDTEVDMHGANEDHGNEYHANMHQDSTGEGEDDRNEDGAGVMDKDDANMNGDNNDAIQDATVVVDEPILRNLSKKVYIRQSAIPVRLGDALLTQICWSSDRSISMCYEKDLHRGAWAGDRFDIRYLRTHEAEVRKNEGGTGDWKDVSKQIADIVSEIWESEYGPKWKKHVRV